jgi:thioredoxin reductase
MNDLDEYDVIVIGGSAAGLSAALVLTRARRRVAVIDSGEPRNAPAAHMQGFLSRDGMPPSELVAAGRAEVQRYGGLLIEDVVTEVLRHDGPHFLVRLATGATMSARRVLFATDGRIIARSAVFVRPRFESNNDLLTGLGCVTGDNGWPVIDGTGATSVPGVWVAGNAANPRAQVITAAGEGSAAAIAINNDLVDEDVRRAVLDTGTGHHRVNDEGARP